MRHTGEGGGPRAAGHADLEEAVGFIDPATLDYEGWCEVGMALKESGLPLEVWDAWSRRDPARYHEGECARKWASFGSTDGPRVGPGTVAKMARDRGWAPAREGRGVALDWEGTVSGPILDPSWVEPSEIEADPGRTGAEELSEYIRALFDPEDFVGYVMTSARRDGSLCPSTQGSYARTAGDLLDELARRGDVAAALGDYDPEAGAWIRFNPLDGRGVGNRNVAEYRYALVESDSVPREMQLSIVRELRLPCAAIVDSGHKSLHAIVRVDAADYDEYRRRVNLLYRVCDENGLAVDGQNKNPSRLSRMPGVTRGDSRQSLVSGPCGMPSWDEWWEWVQAESDDLPDDTNSDWDEPIRLAPVLVGTEEDGLLRAGQKMVLAGPSKAGKSFALIDLAEALACGGRWLGYPCAEGPVYYVNLEIEDQSFRQRQHVVWADRERQGDVGSGVGSVKRNFFRLDLRGRAAELSELAPHIVRRVLRRGARGTFAAVIIDPIYKVNGGDENDARAISAFTNQLDRIARECGCAVIYAHHFAKGLAGQRKSIDRMSGSGVFARDADAILSLTEIEVPDGERDRLGGATAWRMEATLREFRSPEPIDLLFEFPRFHRDATGALSRFDVEGADPLREVNERKRERSARERADKVAAMRRCIAECRAAGEVPTRQNVLARLNEGRDEGGRVSMTQLMHWTKDRAEWSPIRCHGAGEGFALYDVEADMAASLDGLPGGPGAAPGV